MKLELLLLSYKQELLLFETGFNCLFKLEFD